ncbi:MAG: hypothetical protein ACP5RT_00755 [Candidatus Micrarchaeia archaeon]
MIGDKIPKYYKISDKNETLYIIVDDSGALIIKDIHGKTVYLSRYQAKLMKFSIDNIFNLNSNGKVKNDVHVEEISKDEMEKTLSQ